MTETKTAEELAEQMWVKYIDYLRNQKGMTEEEAEHCLGEKHIRIWRWSRRLAEDPSWVPVQTIYYSTVKPGGESGGGIIERPMDFLRVG